MIWLHFCRFCHFSCCKLLLTYVKSEVYVWNNSFFAYCVKSFCALRTVKSPPMNTAYERRSPSFSTIYLSWGFTTFVKLWLQNNMCGHTIVSSIRPCQIGILLSVNSSLTNLGTYSQKHTNRKRKHKYFTKITIEKKTLS